MLAQLLLLLLLVAVPGRAARWRVSCTLIDDDEGADEEGVLGGAAALAGEHAALAALGAWCAADDACAAAYYQRPARNDTLFRHLLLQQQPALAAALSAASVGGGTSIAGEAEITGSALARAFAARVCAGAAGDGGPPSVAAVGAAWARELVAWRAAIAATTCGANERLEIDQGSGEGHCVCLEDRSCDDTDESQTVLYVIGVIVIILLAAYIVIRFALTQRIIHALHTKRPDSVRRAFATGLS